MSLCSSWGCWDSFCMTTSLCGMWHVACGLWQTLSLAPQTDIMDRKYEKSGVLWYQRSRLIECVLGLLKLICLPHAKQLSSIGALFCWVHMQLALDSCESMVKQKRTTNRLLLSCLKLYFKWALQMTLHWLHHKRQLACNEPNAKVNINFKSITNQALYISCDSKMSTPVGPEPSNVVCPNCHQQVTTRTEPKASTKTHLIALIMCLTW